MRWMLFRKESITKGDLMKAQHHAKKKINCKIRHHKLDEILTTVNLVKSCPRDDFVNDDITVVKVIPLIATRGALVVWKPNRSELFGYIRAIFCRPSLGKNRSEPNNGQWSELLGSIRASVHSIPKFDSSRKCSRPHRKNMTPVWRSSCQF